MNQLPHSLMNSIINFSIIIPHYNIPDLLVRCLKSIPIREDIQVIVVDDCSPNAAQYIKDYSELSRPYLEMFSTPKGGSAGRARNIGLQHARGKWLLFADSDDFFVDDFEAILDRYVDSQEDVVFFNKRTVCSEDITKEATRSTWCEAYIREFLKTGDETVIRVNHFAPWGKMIRRELVVNNDIKFDETRYSNDYFFSTCVGVKARKIAVYDLPIYVVTVRDGSLANNINNKPGEIEIRSSVLMKVQTFLRQNGYRVNFENLFVHLAMLRERNSKMVCRYIYDMHKLGAGYIYIIARAFPDYSKLGKIKMLIKSILAGITNTQDERI